MSNLPAHVPFTQTARCLFTWIPFLGDAEIRVVFALYELTYGDDKGQGVRLFNAEIQAATGLRERAVREAVKTLSERGAIRFKAGKNCRLPSAFQVVIGWKPTPYPGTKGCDTPAPKDGVENLFGNDNSHLNPGTKVRGIYPGTKGCDTPAPKDGVLNTKSNTKKDSPYKSPTPSSEALALFDSLWLIYPKKVAKKEAREAFLKLSPTPELVSQIEAWIKAAISTDQWRDGIILNFATAIRKERWTDDVAGYNRNGNGHRNGTNGHKPAPPVVTEADYHPDREALYAAELAQRQEYARQRQQREANSK